MADILSLPAQTMESHTEAPRYADRLQTTGEQYVRMEKRLIDQAEFLEAMILVLDDVKLTNIRNRDYAMMDIVGEEIPRYQQRLEEVQLSIMELRREYNKTAHNTSSVAN